MLRSKSSGPQEAMSALVKAMHGLPGKGRLRITCVAGGQSTSWTVHHQGKKAVLERARSGTPTLEVITNDDTARAILAGALSPLEAFVQNRLRIRGDVQYARVLLRLLAVRPGMRTEICD
jgi:putative sterol carrier protein